MLHEFQPRSPEETRNRILAATREIFAKKGRRGTTTREIAELAGVNEATLFRHFGNKDAIIDALAERYCETEELQELAASLSGDLEADLHRLAFALVGRMEKVADLIIMSLVEHETDSAMGTAPWRAPSAIRQIVGDYMAKRVESGDLQGDPLLLARVFMGMVFAHVIGRKKLPEMQYSTQEIIEFHINVFLNGVRKKK
jgi:AcrR family transcriptional regulator